MHKDAKIGITLNADWGEQMTENHEDEEAAFRFVEWQVGMYFDPIFFGDWPHSMKKMVGDRLPKFTHEQKELVKGSHDGIYYQNFYTSSFV
jgi:beta-glucosidase/6-phospho-beta-glucosidase/beta-galactosidase